LIFVLNHAAFSDSSTYPSICSVWNRRICFHSRSYKIYYTGFFIFLLLLVFFFNLSSSVIRGRHNDRSASFGETSMSALQFDLPFKIRKSKLDTLSGQDFVKYSQLATNPVYNAWRDAFGRTPGFNIQSGVNCFFLFSFQHCIVSSFFLF
jgi:hypothetical protein